MVYTLHYFTLNANNRYIFFAIWFYPEAIYLPRWLFYRVVYSNTFVFLWLKLHYFKMCSQMSESYNVCSAKKKKKTNSPGGFEGNYFFFRKIFYSKIIHSIVTLNNWHKTLGACADDVNLIEYLPSLLQCSGKTLNSCKKMRQQGCSSSLHITTLHTTSCNVCAIIPQLNIHISFGLSPIKCIQLH